MNIRVILLVIFTGVVVLLLTILNIRGNKNTPFPPSVSIDGNIFKVELAKTSAEREKGLAGHTPLTDNQGMLFIFQRGEPTSFWMKGMTFPIDIIWIKDNKVIYFVENAPIPKVGQLLSDLITYHAPETAEYVLEVKAGIVKKFSFQVGEQVILNL